MRSLEVRPTEQSNAISRLADNLPCSITTDSKALDASPAHHEAEPQVHDLTHDSLDPAGRQEHQSMPLAAEQMT